MFHKENFQYQKGDLIKVIKSVIMMIMMKNIKKMDPKLKEETVNEIVKKENNKEKRRNLKSKCTLIKEKRDGIK